MLSEIFAVYAGPIMFSVVIISFVFISIKKIIRNPLSGIAYFILRCSIGLVPIGLLGLGIYVHMETDSFIAMLATIGFGWWLFDLLLDLNEKISDGRIRGNKNVYKW